MTSVDVMSLIGTMTFASVIALVSEGHCPVCEGRLGTGRSVQYDRPVLGYCDRCDVKVALRTSGAGQLLIYIMERPLISYGGRGHPSLMLPERIDDFETRTNQRGRVASEARPVGSRG